MIDLIARLVSLVVVRSFVIDVALPMPLSTGRLPTLVDLVSGVRFARSSCCRLSVDEPILHCKSIAS